MPCNWRSKMAFTREELSQYEKGPQKQIDNKVNPFRGATPAKTAGATDVAGAVVGNADEKSRILDIAPGGTPADRGAASASDDGVVVDEDGTIGDQSETGEGTSDEQSDSSPDLTDSGGDADPNADLTVETGQEEPAAAQAPAKGSAQERIVELNDKLEGAMVFGKAMQEQLKATLAENARLAAEHSAGTSGASAAAPPAVVSDDPGPIPDMSDEDVAFDSDKYRAKMQEWSTKNARYQARVIIREMTGAAQAQSLAEQVNTKVETYAKEHPEFQEVVTNNPVLRANQLAQDAGLAVARSAYTPELLMKFGQDPAFAIRVAKLSPADQLLVVGEMIADVKAEKKAGKTTTTTASTNKSTTTANRGGAQPAARKSISQAPPPPRATTGGGANVRFNPLDANASMDDFVRDHRKGKETARQENRRLRGLK
jgi:hypothetical protein